MAVRSHIWIGNWSFLGVRSWMYQVVFWLFLITVAGLLLRRMRVASPVLSPLLFTYGVFAASLAYYATQVLQSTGESVAQGWYAACLIPVEATLFVAGARAWFPRFGTLLIAVFQLFLLALLFYTSAFISLPYYAGLTSHAAGGGLVPYHMSSGTPH